MAFDISKVATETKSFDINEHAEEVKPFNIEAVAEPEGGFIDKIGKALFSSEPSIAQKAGDFSDASRCSRGGY